MKTLFLDASAGASGDMLMGALYGLCPDRPAFLAAMNALPIPGLALCPEPMADGVHMSVTIHGREEGHDSHHGHSHRNLDDILSMIRSFPLPPAVLDNACSVYETLAGAESKAHGRPVAEIHFHEVGMDDAIADIVGVSLLLDGLLPDEVVCTPIAVGRGTVRCAHGELPVPAPATAHLLEGLPTVPGPGMGELCTPTGAALLRRFVNRFEPSPIPAGAVFGYGSRRFSTHKNAVAACLLFTETKV